MAVNFLEFKNLLLKLVNAVTINNGVDRSKTIESSSLTYIERLKKKEDVLHELLIGQTQELKIARDYGAECQTAVETTMRQLEEVRHHLYRLWQQAP